MKRRDRRQTERNKKKYFKKEKTPPKWIVAISVIIGAIVGVSYWYFVSRCGGKDCLSNYFPFGELLCSELFFWLLPYVLYGNR